MTLELEITIMNEIGLGMSYQWNNGSGSCEYIRQKAMRDLPGVILKHHEAGEPILAPDSRLINLADVAASWDSDQYILTIAWQVASEVIRAHMEATYRPEEEQPAFLDERYQLIKQYYQPKDKQSMGYSSRDKWRFDFEEEEEDEYNEVEW